MDMLPEGCVAKVLSLTTPKDACRLSLVGNTFHWAAESDDVWDKFLPADYKDIISRATTLPTPQFNSKKQLYLWLADNPLVIDNKTKSFSLEKKTGKICYMLAAGDLTIVWADSPLYWKWTSMPDSRFGEVAELRSVCWLEIRGKINASLLSPNTTYTAVLVYKFTPEASGFIDKLVEVSIGIKGGETKTRTVFVDPFRRRRGQLPIRPRPLFGRRSFVYRSVPRLQHVRASELTEVVEEEDKVEKEDKVDDCFPKLRGDGWLEIKLGDYFNGNGEYNEEERELEMSLMEVKAGDWKIGLVVQGIEIRPKVADIT